MREAHATNNIATIVPNHLLGNEKVCPVRIGTEYKTRDNEKCVWHWFWKMHRLPEVRFCNQDTLYFCHLLCGLGETRDFPIFPREYAGCSVCAENRHVVGCQVDEIGHIKERNVRVQDLLRNAMGCVVVDAHLDVFVLAAAGGLILVVVEVPL